MDRRKVQPEQERGADPERERLALEWELVRLERQKLALELELKEKRNNTMWKDLLANPVTVPVTVAIVGGALALMTTILTNFYTASANRDAEQSRARLVRESAQQSLQAELIKKFVESPKTETVRENLRFLIDAGLLPDYAYGIRGYLAANPGAAPQVGSMLDFSSAGEAVSESLKVQLQDTLGKYRIFLSSLGFKYLDDRISVFVYSQNSRLPIEAPFRNDARNSFYMSNTLYIHKDMSQDVSITLREYTHHALLKALEPGVFQQTEVESALAGYLPATFLNSPIMGAKTPFIRNIDNKTSYTSIASDDRVSWYERGIVWAGALWACRQREGQQRVDELMLPAWQQANVPPIQPSRVAARFGAALAAAPLPVGQCFTEEIARRGLPRGT